MSIWTKQDPPVNNPAKHPPNAPSFSSDIAPKIIPTTPKIIRIQIHILFIIIVLPQSPEESC